MVWISACAKGGDPWPVCPYLTGSTGYPPPGCLVSQPPRLLTIPAPRQGADEREGGGVGMSPLVYGSRLQRAAPIGRSPFAALSLRRRWCPSAPHYPASSLSLRGLSFLLYFPFLSLGRSCQRSPQTFPVPLLRVGSVSGGEGVSACAGGTKPLPIPCPPTALDMVTTARPEVTRFTPENRSFQSGSATARRPRFKVHGPYTNDNGSPDLENTEDQTCHSRLARKVTLSTDRPRIKGDSAIPAPRTTRTQ